MGRLPLTLRRWKRAEYERLVDLGVFEGEAVELIGGHVIIAEPQNSSHATAVGAADDTLRAVLPPGFVMRAQMPIALNDDSAPEPDLAVVAGRRADYRHGNPTGAVLVVEVADASLHFDRDVKGSLYARDSIMEYWIVNVNRPGPEGPSRAGARPDGGAWMALPIGVSAGVACAGRASHPSGGAGLGRRFAALAPSQSGR